MAKVLVVHPFLDVKGGAEVLALKLAKALSESGFKVSILTTGVNRDEIEKLFGIDLAGIDLIMEPVKSTRLLSMISENRFTRLRILMATGKYYRDNVDLIKSYDIVIGTQGVLSCLNDVSYVHYPLSIYTSGRRSLHWRLYDYLVRAYAKHLECIPAGRILTNSMWTASIIYRIYHIIPDVVYPPVDIEYFAKVASNDKREKIIVTTSRFATDKPLDKIIDVASKLSDYQFVLIGSANKYSKGILEELNKKIKEYGLGNVVIEANLPREKQLEYYARAKYYLHPEYAEHFGISIVEAMASGLVPIVYRDGGGWYDVVSKVHDVLGYNSILEAPAIIRKLDSELELYEYLKQRSIEVAKQFSYERFRLEIVKHMNYVLDIKSLVKTHRVMT